MGNIELLGPLPFEETIEQIRQAAFLIFPTSCYEFGRVIQEAFMCGVPVVASDIGPSKDVIEDGVNGFIFEANNDTQLANIVKNLNNAGDLITKMGENAFREYEKQYSIDNNYQKLMDIYSEVIEEKTCHV